MVLREYLIIFPNNYPQSTNKNVEKLREMLTDALRALVNIPFKKKIYGKRKKKFN